MDLGLAGRRVLITGATRGIGRATARAYVAEGARVVLTYHRSGAEAARVVTELGGAEHARAVPMDLGDPASVRAAVAFAERQWGGVDVVVANAQSWRWVNPEDVVPFEDLPMAEWLPVFRENIEGHLRTVQHAVGGMRERGWGRVVLLSSLTAGRGNPGSELYGAAKAALHGFARGLVWGRGGVLANIVAPGGTVSESLDDVAPELVERERQATPSGRLTTAEEVARLVVFLGSEANGNVNGEVVHTAGGLR